MESRKIGEIYRKKLKNVETPPPSDSWENISAALDEKEQTRRVLPFWFKAAGIAAVVALLLVLFFEPSQDELISDSPRYSNSFSTEKKTYNFDPVSTYFEETMLRSSVLLETLIMNGRNKQSRNSVANIQEEKSQNSTEAVVFEEEAKIDNIPENAIAETENIIEEKNLTEAGTKEPDSQTNIQLTDLEESLVNEEVFEEKDEKDPLAKRFSISPTAGVVFLDNLQNSNSMNQQFAENSGSEMSMAYGVNLAYQVSENVKIRTGVSKMEFSRSGTEQTYASEANSFGVLPNSDRSAGSGNLNQSFGFIEIPLEVEYSLINNKIGLSLIGGASTFVLNEDMVSMQSPYSTAIIEESGNYNNVSFSTNIGLGLNYNLSKELQVHLEPVFKYQISTFEQTSGLNPYFFGIYSGLSFRF